MLLQFFKAIHIVGFVSWFAGLFYLVRMFVYHVEAMGKEEPAKGILTEQFNVMEWRVYRIICNPALAITLISGIGMYLQFQPGWLAENGWMHVKLLLLVLLISYHFYCKTIIVKLESGKSPYSSDQYRLFNEVPTLVLVAIALLAIYKNALNMLYAIPGLLVFFAFIYLATKLYKTVRVIEESRQARK